LTSTERSADNAQTPTINASLGSREISGIRRTSQARSGVNCGIGSARVPRSDLLPPSATTPSRSSQPRDASDPRELSERLAVVSWGTAFANKQPLSSSEESKSTNDSRINRTRPDADNAIDGPPRQSQLENMVNCPKPSFPSPAGPVTSGNGELTWASLFPEDSVILPGPIIDIRCPLPQANQQRESGVEQPPALTAGDGTNVNTTRHMPGAFYACNPQLTRNVSDSLMAQRQASRRHAPYPEPGRDAPHLTSPTGGNRDRTVNPDWLSCQPTKGRSLYSRPPPPRPGDSAFPGDRLGQNPFRGPPSRPSPAMFRESEDEQGVASETSAPRRPWKLHPTSIQGHLSPGLPVPYSSTPATSSQLMNPGQYRPTDWGADVGAVPNLPNPPFEGVERAGELSSQRPYTPIPSYQLGEGAYANFHEQSMDSTNVAPEIRTDLGAAGSEFHSRRPYGAKSTISNWKRRADSNVQGFKELSKRAVGQTGKMAEAFVRGGMKALRPLAGHTSQERYDKYVEVIRQTAEGVPPSSCESVDIKALHRKKCRNPKRMTSEELRVLALASMDVDYDALTPGSDTSGVHYVSEEGIEKWQSAIESHEEDHQAADSQNLRPAGARNPASTPSWFLTTPEGLGIAPGILQQGQRSRHEKTPFGQVASQATVNTGQNAGANTFPRFTPNRPPSVRPQCMCHSTRPNNPRYQPRPGLNEVQLQANDLRFRPDHSTHPNTLSPVNETPSLGLTSKVALPRGSGPPGKPYVWTDRRISEGRKANENWDLREIRPAFGGRVFERRGAVAEAPSEVVAVSNAAKSDAGNATKSPSATAGLAIDVEGVEGGVLVTSRSPRSRRNSGVSRRSSGASGRKGEEELRSKSWPGMGEGRVGDVQEEVVQGTVSI
jgi:hypothetical protein